MEVGGERCCSKEMESVVVGGHGREFGQERDRQKGRGRELKRRIKFISELDFEKKSRRRKGVSGGILKNISRARWSFYLS